MLPLFAAEAQSLSPGGERRGETKWVSSQFWVELSPGITQTNQPFPHPVIVGRRGQGCEGGPSSLRYSLSAPLIISSVLSTILLAICFTKLRKFRRRDLSADQSGFWQHFLFKVQIQNLYCGKQGLLGLERQDRRYITEHN